MRPIEHKVLKKIDKKGLSFEGIEEIIDGTSRQEMKKSFPDDCHFQSNRYFAKTVADSLIRSGKVRYENGKYVKVEPKKEDVKEEL